MPSAHTPALTEALDFLLAHDWKAAHTLVQDLEDPVAWRIHGLVHRVEGDLPNSRYWYNKAGSTFDAARSVEEEVSDIRAKLGLPR